MANNNQESSTSFFGDSDEERRFLAQTWADVYGLQLTFTHPLKDVAQSWAQCKDVYRNHQNPVVFNDGKWMDKYDEKLYDPLELCGRFGKMAISRSRSDEKFPPLVRTRRFKKGEIILSTRLPVSFK